MINPATFDNGVLRLGSAGDWIRASGSAKFDELIGLVLKAEDLFYLPGSIVNGLAGIEMGKVYYLGEEGQLTTEIPTSGYVVVLGKGIGNGILLYAPQIPLEPAVFLSLRNAPQQVATGNN